MSGWPAALGLVATLVGSAPGASAEAPRQLSIAFTGDNGGEIAPCG